MWLDQRHDPEGERLAAQAAQGERQALALVEDILVSRDPKRIRHITPFAVCDLIDYHPDFVNKIIENVLPTAFKHLRQTQGGGTLDSIEAAVIMRVLFRPADDRQRVLQIFEAEFKAESLTSRFRQEISHAHAMLARVTKKCRVESGSLATTIGIEIEPANDDVEEVRTRPTTDLASIMRLVASLARLTHALTYDAHALPLGFYANVHLNYGLARANDYAFANNNTALLQLIAALDVIGITFERMQWRCLNNLIGSEKARPNVHCITWSTRGRLECDHGRLQTRLGAIDADTHLKYFEKKIAFTARLISQRDNPHILRTLKIIKDVMCEIGLLREIADDKHTLRVNKDFIARAVVNHGALRLSDIYPDAAEDWVVDEIFNPYLAV